MKVNCGNCPFLYSFSARHEHYNFKHINVVRTLCRLTPHFVLHNFIEYQVDTKTGEYGLVHEIEHKWIVTKQHYESLQRELEKPQRDKCSLRRELEDMREDLSNKVDEKYYGDD
jgi:hypothetical protein